MLGLSGFIGQHYSIVRLALAGVRGSSFLSLLSPVGHSSQYLFPSVNSFFGCTKGGEGSIASAGLESYLELVKREGSCSPECRFLL